MADYLLPARSIPASADLTIGDDLVVTDELTVLGAATFSGSVAFPVANTLTAFATGGQASATALTGTYNRISVCATHLDSAKLPTGIAGRPITVFNDTAKDAAIYTQTGGQIDALGANAAYVLAAGSTQVFVPFSTTQYYRVNKGERYVDRGDISAADFAQTDLTMDSNYNNLTLTSIIPPSAYGRRVKLRVRISHSAAREIVFRTDGFSNAINTEIVRTQVASDSAPEGIEVVTSAAGVIEYAVASATTAISIAVRGWYVEA